MNRRLLCLIAAAGLCVSCSPSKAMREAVLRPTPRALSRFPAARVVDLTEEVLPGGRKYLYFGVTSDGLVVVQRYWPKGNETVVSYEGIYLLDPATGAVLEEMRTNADPMIQVSYMDADDRYVVWSEVKGFDLVPSEWKIWVYDRQAREARVIGENYVHPDGSPAEVDQIAAQEPRPWIDRGRVVWSQPIGPPHTRSFLVDLTSAAARRELSAKDSVWPAVAWPDVYVFERVGKTRSADLVRRDRQRGTRTVIARRQAGELVANESGALWIDGRNGQVSVYGRGRVAQLGRPEGDHIPRAPVAGDGFFAWSESGGAYLWNTRTQELVELSDQGADLAASGQYLMWTPPSSEKTAPPPSELGEGSPPPRTWRMLDVSTLS